MPALAVTDHGLYGVVRFYQKALEAGVKPIIGCEITLENGHHLTLLARSNKGYTSLCRMLTAANLANARPWVETEHQAPSMRRRIEPASTETDSLPATHCRPLPVSWQNLAEHATDLIALSGCRQGEIPSLPAQGKQQEARSVARRCQEIFGEAGFYLELQNYRTGRNQAALRDLISFGREAQLPLVATNNVHYVDSVGLPDARAADRHPRPDHPGRQQRSARERRRNMEQYLKSARQMAHLFRDCPEAITNTVRIADECQVTLPLGKPRLPAFELPAGETSFSMLYKLAFAGATDLFRPLRPDVGRRLQRGARHHPAAWACATTF